MKEDRDIVTAVILSETPRLECGHGNIKEGRIQNEF